MRAGWLLFWAMSAQVAIAEAPATLDAAKSSLEDLEVEISGHIGLDPMDEDRILFRGTDGGTHKVIFDAGRAARKMSNGCQFKIFGGTPCAVTARAELRWDRADLDLVVFELVDIAGPSPL